MNDQQWQSSGAGEGGNRAHAMARLQQCRTQVRTALGQCLAMTSPGRRHDDDARASEVGAPAQVDVVTIEVDRSVEAGDRPEQVGAHHQACRRQGEDVADRVVLLLVDLALFDERVRLAEAVDADPDVLQHTGVVPRDQLRADDAGVRSVQLFDEQTNGAGIEGNVVV